MLHLKTHDLETAPAGSVPALAEAKATYGFIPNLMGSLANAPAAATAYMAVAKAFDGSSLTPKEQQVVLLATSFENRCHYCMAAHSVVGGMVGLSSEEVAALREGTELSDPRLEAVRRFTASVVRHRAWIPEEDLVAFRTAGFGPEQVLEVLTGVTLKTLSNYMNHLAATPVDGRFSASAWVHPEEHASVPG